MTLAACLCAPGPACPPGKNGCPAAHDGPSTLMPDLQHSLPFQSIGALFDVGPQCNACSKHACHAQLTPRTCLPQLIVYKFKLGCHAIPRRSFGTCHQLRGHINVNVNTTRRVLKVLWRVLQNILETACQSRQQTYCVQCDAC